MAQSVDIFNDAGNNLEELVQEDNPTIEEYVRSDAENEDGQDNTQAELDTSQTAQKVKQKRVVRNPQPKLNDQLLRGPRGLTALPRLFKRIQMKGAGHETEDLSAILRTYEYWCHRMFPKFRFDECVEKLDKLGSKKRTMTYVKQIRMGLIEDEEVEQHKPPEDGDEAIDDVPRNEDINLDDDVAANRTVQPMVAREPPSVFDQLRTEVAPIQVTEEMQQRIRLNRERAMQLRAKKLQESQSLTQNEQVLITSNADDVTTENVLIETLELGQSETNDGNMLTIDEMIQEMDGVENGNT